MKIVQRLIGLGALLTTALPVFATTSTAGLTFQQLVDQKIVPLVDTGVIPLLYSLAFLFLVIGIVRYFFTGGAENREQGRGFIIWAMVGMVIIFSVWGIIKILVTTLLGTSA